MTLGAPIAGLRLPGRTFWLGLLVAAPWLNPFASGPSPAAVQWLVSAGCAAAFYVWITAQQSRLPRQTNEVISAIALGWLLAAVVSSFFGLAQYMGWAGEFGVWINASAAGEAYANLRQRNHLATLTNMGLLAVVWAVRTHRCGNVAWWLAAVLCTANAATASRTGMTQLAAVVGLVVLASGGQRKRVIQLCVWGLAIYLLASAVLPLISNAFRGEAGQSVLVRLSQDLGCSSRKILWSNVLELIAEKPWTGWGWGELDYAHYAHLYRGERFCAILDNAHNLPMHMAVELGVPFAVLVSAATVWAMVRARPWRETDPARQLAWGVVAMIALHSLVEYPLWYGPFLGALGLCIFVLWPDRFSPVAPAQRKSGIVQALHKFVAIVIIAVVGYSAFDYHRISQLYLMPEERSERYRNDTLRKASSTWIFQHQVEFAELTLSLLERENAASQNTLALRLLHYSPEPQVIEKVIGSALLLGLEEQARWHLARYRVAFPNDHAAWLKGSADMPTSTDLTR